MPYFRGSRGSRGGRGGRGGRGNSRGGGKLARSGIRTRGGYKKFDSQRVKDIEPDDSENDAPDVVEEVEEVDDDVSESEDDDAGPSVRPYSALLQSLQPPPEENERKAKRRKIEASQDVESEDGDVEDILDLQQDDGIDNADEEAADIDDVHEDEDEDTSDPFEMHFADPDDNEISNRLKAVQRNEWRTEKRAAAGVGKLLVSAPQCVHGNILLKPMTGTDELAVKNKLKSAIEKAFGSFDPLQQAIAPHLFNYTDLLVANRTPHNADQLRQLTCLHALNHILKGRDKVLKNNYRLSQAKSATDLEFRDQGFTRPKVLILLETRQMCFNYAKCITDLLEPDQQENKDRFVSSFNTEDDTNPDMPEDFAELFEGNSDNDFLTAIKLNRKSLKFYSPFYTSDILLASPLGLCRILSNEDHKKRDHDFLSSIEIVLVDQADAMYMQNWSNVETVFAHLNLALKEAHDCDFSRVRNWYLDGHAQYLRQTIVMGAYLTPEMNRLFNKSMQNIAGKVKMTPSYDEGGVIDTIHLGVKQTFSRFDSASAAADPDARFKFFSSAILPSLLRRQAQEPADSPQGILLFIPTYYDFIRLRNFFATSTLTENISFGSISEYTSVPEQRRARAHFVSGRHSVLLYTQRAHHFFRLKLRGVKKVVLYGLPDNEHFYEGFVGGFLGTTLSDGKVSAEELQVRALFSKWDGLKLERIVGGHRLKAMLGGGGAGKGDVFEFL